MAEVNIVERSASEQLQRLRDRIALIEAEAAGREVSKPRIRRWHGLVQAQGEVSAEAVRDWFGLVVRTRTCRYSVLSLRDRKPAPKPRPTPEPTGMSWAGQVAEAMGIELLDLLVLARAYADGLRIDDRTGKPVR